MKDIITLGIESSCDETSVAVVKNGREVLSNVINSQIKIHEKFGGVVPEIASRNHVEAISLVTKQALEEAKVEFKDIEHIACTYGPGLVGALLVGVSYAKGLSYALNKPLTATNLVNTKTVIALPEITVNISKDATDKVRTSLVGGRRCLVIDIDDPNVVINGLPTTIDIPVVGKKTEDIKEKPDNEDDYEL